MRRTLRINWHAEKNLGERKDGWGRGKRNNKWTNEETKKEEAIKDEETTKDETKVKGEMNEDDDEEYELGK